MTSSKVILVGAISVVFGLYSLSLYRVNGYIGSTAEVSTYINRASDNARAGAQRALDLWARGNDNSGTHGSSDFPSTETFSNLIDASPALDCFTYNVTASFPYNDGKTYTMKIVSKGYYRAPSEPSSFQGHEVDRTVYASFVNTNKGGGSHPWYNITVTSVYSSINYTAEKQLESLQGYKSNMLGY